MRPIERQGLGVFFRDAPARGPDEGYEWNTRGGVVMKVRVYQVVTRAIEEGISRGWRRAHKHTDNPGVSAIQGSIYDEVLNALHEVIDFDEGEEDKIDLALEAIGEES